MSLNLLKKYNQLLDISGMNEYQRIFSLKAIFNRDFIDNGNVFFREKLITPTPNDGIVTMETLFNHLIKRMVDKETRKREFELERSQRLHWVKFHLEESKKVNMLIFSVKEPDGFRTYIYDIDEKYVIVLEPLRDGNSYYLLSAHYVQGKDAQRDKFKKKYKRRLDELL